MIKSIIVAKSKNHVIGVQGKLPWHLPKDLQFFKQKTWGHHVMMGRKTYESLGRPLKNRVLIIVTRQKNYQINGGIAVATIQKGFDFAKKSGENELFIAGGGHIYQQTIEVADKIYSTLVHTVITGDTYFPMIDTQIFSKKNTSVHTKNEKHIHDFCFELWERALPCALPCVHAYINPMD